MMGKRHSAGPAANASEHAAGQGGAPMTASAPAASCAPEPVSPVTLAAGAEPSGSCAWTPSKGYAAWTKYGEIQMFEQDGQRAVELMLLSAASCLNFFLVEYAKGRGLPVSSIRVTCDGEPVKRPERLSRIISRVVIEGNLTDEERRKMLDVCERACKVMNTLRHQPECETLLLAPSGRQIA